MSVLTVVSPGLKVLFERIGRAAEVLLVLARDRRGYTFSVEQIDGIKHAMAQTGRGEFASENRLQKIFGRSL